MGALLGVVREHWRALLYGVAATLPLASLLLQTIVAEATGVHLKVGDWLMHLLATAAVALPGLLLLGAFVYRTRGSRPRPPYLRLLLLAIVAALVIAGLWLASLEREAWCGGALGECGRWI